MNATTHLLDAAEAEAFVRAWLNLTSTGHITLTAIPAAGGATVTKTFVSDDFETMRRWIEAHQGGFRNIYFQVNETHPQCAKKPSKNDMIAVNCRHADVDPVDALHPYLEERDRLHRLGDFLHQDATMPPSVVLDSGNGIYPIWIVTRQLLASGVQEEIEAENQAIEAAVGAGGTFNIDRLLRLPGTLNFPNAKKLKLGRGMTRARMLHQSARTYTPEQAAGLGAHLGQLLGDSDLVRPYVAPAGPEAAGPKQKKAKASDKFGRDRSATALRKGAALRRAGKTFEEMCAALAADPETADWTKEKGEANGSRELHRIWDKASPTSTGPVIRVIAGQLHITTTAAEDALIASGLPIYQRGDGLVQPVTREVPASRGRMTLAAGLGEMNVYSMVDVMCATAEYERYDARSEDWVRINPPAQIAQTLLSRHGKWRFQVIAGIITTPTLRPNGTLLTAPGYDAATRLYHVADPSLRLHPEVHAPTRNTAERALKVLLDLMVEFSFVKLEQPDKPDLEVAKAVALSALITPTVRGAMSVAPLHAVNAHAPGSGKTFLIDLVSMITSARPCPAITAAPDEAETEKRIAGLLLAGYPIVSIDNCNGELGGDLLCQAIERPLIRIRRLGGSDITEIESSVTIFATGNNLRVRGDMVRRSLVAELDPQMERPELRKFKHDPIAAILADRGRYVSACLIIVRAYILAGSPNKLPAIASFEGWSDLVRSALVWLGCADPALSMEAAREDDPELSELREVLAVWSEALGCDEAFTTKEVADEIAERLPTQMGEPTDFAHPELRDALLRLAGAQGTLNTRRLGQWLLSKAGRIVGTQRFVKAGKAHGGVLRWAVQSMVRK
jgi:hypothetical protein